MKLWIYDQAQIDIIIKNDGIKKSFECDEDGALIGVKGKFENWRIRTIAYTGQLEISGSIHRYWNGGTNENDFTFQDCIRAIKKLCSELNINPKLAFVINLEFGVNLQLDIDASEILKQFIAYRYHEPDRRLKKRANCYFLEVELTEYYLKLYDKGKQFRQRLPETPNTLRIEIKAMKNRVLREANIKTLDDLQQPEKLQVLGVKFVTLLKGLVFDDDTINLKDLTATERNLYREIDRKSFWKGLKGNATPTVRKKINRYKSLIDRSGKRNIHTLLNGAIIDKLKQLSGMPDFTLFTPNTYSVNTDT